MKLVWALASLGCPQDTQEKKSRRQIKRCLELHRSSNHESQRGCTGKENEEEKDEHQDCTLGSCMLLCRVLMAQGYQAEWGEWDLKPHALAQGCAQSEYGEPFTACYKDAIRGYH